LLARLSRRGRTDPDAVGGEDAEGDFAGAGADAEGVVVVAREWGKGDTGADAESVEELEETCVAFVKARDNDGRTSAGFGEWKQAAALELRGSFGEDAISVRTFTFLAEALDELGFKGGRDDVLEAFGFGVNLVPLHAEDLGEHALNEVVAECGAVRGFASLGCELERAVGRRVYVAVFAKAAESLCDRGRRDAEPLGEEGRDDGVAFALGLEDGLEVVLFGDGDFCSGHS